MRSTWHGSRDPRSAFGKSGRVTLASGFAWSTERVKHGVGMAVGIAGLALGCGGEVANGTVTVSCAKGAPVCHGTCTSGRCLETLAGEQSTPQYVAVDALNVYWTASTTGETPPDRRVVSVPIGGGALTTIASGLSGPFIATSSEAVFWTDDASPELGSIVVAGATRMTLARGQAWPEGVAVGAEASHGWPVRIRS